MLVVVKVQYLAAGISFKELLKTVIGCSSPETALACAQKCHRTCEELGGGDGREHLCYLGKGKLQNWMHMFFLSAAGDVTYRIWQRSIFLTACFLLKCWYSLGKISISSFLL